MDETIFYGRHLLRSEYTGEWDEEEEAMRLIVTEGFNKENSQLTCNRCGTLCTMTVSYPCVCQNRCKYCRQCIKLGKITECSHLYSLEEPNQFPKHAYPYLKWTGTLSKQQAQASKDIRESIDHNSDRMIWAVAGAGKTEMLFEGVGQALEEGKRVCLATPRVDVALELAPRLIKAFPEVSLAVLYGGTAVPYQYTQLVISTTHQLYRFKEAFDVLIIDEVDAFPYYLNDALYFASEKARKIVSSVIYLTATPDKSMQKRIKRREIEASILPARYHGRPLPVPVGIWVKKSILKTKQNDTHIIIRHMKRLIEEGKQFLLFIPTISLMEQLLPIFEHSFKQSTFEWVHSQDPHRKEKVKKMREGGLQFLMTTTILERGVTFPNIDVIVMNADHRVFTEAALVQIAGRVGRAPDYPSGEVTYYHEVWTRAMKNAIKQIKNMNAVAARNGYLV